MFRKNDTNKKRPCDQQDVSSMPVSGTGVLGPMRVEGGKGCSLIEKSFFTQQDQVGAGVEEDVGVEPCRGATEAKKETAEG